jgi:type III pantothenate kinase
MILLVDCGNTRLKWAVSAAQGRASPGPRDWPAGAPDLWRTGVVGLAEGDPQALLDQFWRDLPKLQRAVVCCVAGEATLAAINRWLRARRDVEPVVFRSAARTLDIVNGYREPTSLGADRWASLLGARGLTREAVCVVDCGTAVTIDALSAAGEFAGGVIFPGLRLLRASLARGTDAVRPPPGGDASCLALSTADAVAGGTLFGLAGAIERVLREQEARLGTDTKGLITGGDAELLAARIARPLRHVPDLVLQGLARFAETL